MPLLQPIKHEIIHKDGNYNCFPSIVQMQDGRLAISFRQAPDRQRTYGQITHLDPASKAVYLVTKDGETWNRDPLVLYDDYFCGVQDPCLNVLQDGTLFATFFMWKVYDADDVQDRSGSGLWSSVYGKWLGRIEGVYTVQSTDGGQTWSSPVCINIADTAIRGNCTELEDGTIMAPLYRITEGGASEVLIAETKDRGETWSILAAIADCDGHYFYEPNLYRTASGKLVAFIRSMKISKEDGAEHKSSPLFTSESSDNGKTWSLPVKHAIDSPSPFHLLRLEDGNVLLTYGYRHKPYGIRAIVLDAECGNIDEAEEIIVREDAPGRDIGYTSAVQLEGGNVFITYYYYDAQDGLRYIAGSLCEVNGS
ncbi:sialidase family protein [Paenibacillus contaminans]|uniref:Sialidase domain-containing protein n=1 Tax=Paenibacillus contaminans TaxID=450362 RepID=A0A329MNR8_9BACL|nr:sialidase family protein [Paenibacillus contaminans]RAV21539.1 hypothetical protein DQG23_09740 [Paenibacillus contaminans]